MVLSKNDWYGGYGFVPAKDNYEETIIKKENLKRQFIKMCSTDRPHRMNEDKSTFEIEEINVKSDDNESLYKNKISLLKKENSAYKKDVLAMKKELDKIKRIRFEQLNTINSHKNEIEQLKEELEKVKLSLEEERNANKFLKKEIEKHVNSFDKREFKSIKVQNQKLLVSNQKLQNKLSIAKKQIQNYQLIRNGEIDSALILKYKEQLTQKKNENQNLKQKLCLTHNVINNLNAKIGNKKRKVILKKIDEYNKSIVFGSSTVKEQVDDNIIFGFISLNKDRELIFVDVNNKRYTVSKSNDKKRLISNVGMPARAIKLGDIALIDYVYYTVNKESKYKNNISNKINISKEKLNELIGKKDELKGKKILIVGSKRKGYYCSSLSRLGAEVIYHESFSDNETRLISLAPSCDVVLVCTSHVSHSVIYEMKNIKDFNENNIKYQMIEKDNVQNLIHRVRYVLENS